MSSEPPDCGRRIGRGVRESCGEGEADDNLIPRRATATSMAEEAPVAASAARVGGGSPEGMGERHAILAAHGSAGTHRKRRRRGGDAPAEDDDYTSGANPPLRRGGGAPKRRRGTAMRRDDERHGQRPTNQQRNSPLSEPAVTASTHPLLASPPHYPVDRGAGTETVPHRSLLPQAHSALLSAAAAASAAPPPSGGVFLLPTFSQPFAGVATLPNVPTAAAVAAVHPSLGLASSGRYASFPLFPGLNPGLDHGAHVSALPVAAALPAAAPPFFLLGSAAAASNPYWLAAHALPASSSTAALSALAALQTHPSTMAAALPSPLLAGLLGGSAPLARDLPSFAAGAADGDLDSTGGLALLPSVLGRGSLPIWDRSVDPPDVDPVAAVASSSRSAASTASATPPRPPPSQRTTAGRPPTVLYMECDADSLSPYQCLARKQIELFEALNQDVESNAQGRNRPIVLGQVGIRCRHCSCLPPKQRVRGAVYYPSRLCGLYQAAQNLAISHLGEHCPQVPDDVRAELRQYRERKSSAGGGKKYWAEGVRALGVYEDADGLRFEPLPPR